MPISSPAAIRGHGKALLVIGFGLAIMVASVLHVLAPAARPIAVRSNASSVARPSPVTAVQRPSGVLHIGDTAVPAPEMQPLEREFVESLPSLGFRLMAVEASTWDSQLDQAHADVVLTNVGDLTVVAPDGPGFPLWLCPRSIAAVSGADVRAYEVSAGGDRFTIQIDGILYAGRVGEVLVLTQQAVVWQQLSPIVSPAACPG